MNKHLSRISTLLLAGTLLPVAATTLWAHDDGLTCHHHPSSSRVKITSYSVNGSGLDDGSIPIEAIQHSFDNLLAADPSPYPEEEVRSVRRGIGELIEMVEAVRLLVVRAERLSDPAEADLALGVARSAFDQLPLSSYMAFEEFLAENRPAGSVSIAVETIADYLKREAGISDALAVVVEQSAAAC